uniref:Nucleoside diphosphate kinase n=1 Tax=Zonotrichia albicollis TaxID=44394 RepID=A0A8D2M7R6_ZONAL
MGPTKVFRARHSDPDSIRGAYGLTDTRNTTHGSDSPASASREIAFFFPEFDEQRWYEQEEPRLRRGQLFHGGWGWAGLCFSTCFFLFPSCLLTPGTPTGFSPSGVHLLPGLVSSGRNGPVGIS